MFAKCKGPIWRLDDFSRCFEQDYLQTLFPLIVCGASLSYLSIQIFRATARSKQRHAYQPLKNTGHVDSRNGLDPRPNGPFSDEDDPDSDDEFLRNERSALHRAPSNANESFIQVDRPRGELLVVVVEELAVLSEVGIHLAVVLTESWGHRGRVAAISTLATWVYVAILASLRLLLSSSSRFSFPRLWYHTSFIYIFLWIFTTLMFRSAIIHPLSRLSRDLTIANFSLVSLLATIALTSRKGNKAVELEYEGDLEPSKEQTASVLSLATFGWVDGIVWKGYKKTYELSDVWNLAPKDKAAWVLNDYRQVKKTTILAWHILKYFKRGLIIQALWAAFSGLLLFAPTLLLKAILEYVEQPEMTPQNAAWFYVILLFVSGCASALADGQALWIGRKICIRMRAVIIGEIYAKALKRRVSAGADKVLGENKKTKGGKESTKQKMKRVLSFGRKKKAENAKNDGSLKSESSEQVTSGAIINLMAVDSFKVSEICAYLHFLWANTPVQAVVAIFLLYRILGYSSIAGIGMMALLLPINLTISKKFAKIQKQILAATDARINTTNEVLSNIRIIKYFAWEQRFMGVIDEKRSVELKHLRRRYTWWAIAATVWSGAPIMITFLSFFVYTVIEKKDLIPSVAFTALSLFQILRIPLDQLADMVAHVQESKVSVDRIEEYLKEPETDKYRQLHKRDLDENGEPIIGFDNGTFSWGSNDPNDKDAADAFKMIGLNMRFNVGNLNVVVGPTGCGKTSLLMALLGEMTALEGRVHLPGAVSREELKPDPESGLTESVAYCAQQAWLVNDTIKENILFAGPWDPKRYQDVIAACSLKRDLEILDDGDQTLVGEKGVTLSGGQKQRISLARALYSKARHVLLDDVLSAVDSHTAKWIFDKAILGPLMYNRTCILVTHNVTLCLPYAQFAVVLDNGRVVAQGSAHEVIDSGTLTEDLTKSRPTSTVPSRVPSRLPSDDGSELIPTELHQPDAVTEGANPGSDTDVTLVGEPAMGPHLETKATGSVKLNIIILYLRSMGPWYFWMIAALVFASQQASSVATNVWIRAWANAYADKQVSFATSHKASHVTHFGPISGLGTCLTSGSCVWPWPTKSISSTEEYDVSWQTRVFSGASEVDAGYYLTVYATLGLCFMAVTLSREAVLFGGSLHASRMIHTRLISSVTHAKFRFFDSTPLGQLMNRFSKDIEAVDQEIAPVAVGVVHCLASIITIVILISVITPGFLIAGVFITALYFLIGKFYINSSRDLKRLESVQRSPLYQQFGETLSGMTTIRAYGDERRFIRDNLNRINTHNRPFIFLWAANRWLALRVDVVGAMVSFFAGVFVVLSVGRIDAGAAGLAMTYAVTFTENVLWFVRLYSSNEQNMNSVERIKEYLDVEQEAPPIIPDSRPPANWPSKGSVEFADYSTRYRQDFGMVLKKVSFKVLPGEKVGVVGRTGAGKSSLALALFRALEAEEGRILVDGLDIGTIGLQDLRENIVMVPQDPTLFTGTVRSNLDPFSLFTDEEIFTALRRVQLIGPAGSQPASGSGSPNGTASNSPPPSSNGNKKRIDFSTDTVSSSPTTTTDTLGLENKNIFNTLTSPISESGSNLSQGQRQLLCLARALLKEPKVLLMDEATASIDYATDAKIQETIREIKNTTITIAHRLQTIIDYDKVIVLEKGEVVEFGSPWELIKKEKGRFRGMCEMSGDLEGLEHGAEEASKAKKLVDDT
ncbi:hypothetical protein M501DRAFT_928819 [Patellaria atrata CBS 101060]|uniref:ATP-dependent bile acid permease n=1 Tax=Patellaria atrata CBS 101060 TaxID=1346257 RepID=A0A9P4VTJ6_9PEZI|nr:hypothetical protein M501DRAFT_928819 [Patellaria atrata CBS 101060]